MEKYHEISDSKGILIDAEKNYKYAITGYRRAKALESWMFKNFDPGIIAKYHISQCTGDVAMVIYLEKDDYYSMEKLIHWFKSMKGKRFLIEKMWSKNNGRFYYVMSRNYNNSWCGQYEIFFKNGYDLDNCKIIEKEKMIKYFSTDCENEKILVDK